MTEADKDALLVRAAIDIMAMQSHIALLAAELNETKQQFSRFRRAVDTSARYLNAAGRRERASALSLRGAMTRHVVEMYRSTDGNIEHTAKLLDIQRSRLYRLLPVNIHLERKRKREAEARRHETRY